MIKMVWNRITLSFHALRFWQPRLWIPRYLDISVQNVTFWNELPQDVKSYPWKFSLKEKKSKNISKIYHLVCWGKYVPLLLIYINFLLFSHFVYFFLSFLFLFIIYIINYPIISALVCILVVFDLDLFPCSSRTTLEISTLYFCVYFLW